MRAGCWELAPGQSAPCGGASRAQAQRLGFKTAPPARALQVCVATYDSAIHYYSLRPHQSQPHMLVVPDVTGQRRRLSVSLCPLSPFCPLRFWPPWLSLHIAAASCACSSGRSALE